MKYSHTMLNVGLMGLGIHLCLNLLGFFVFHRAAAVPFTEEWWSTWFPSLLAWVAIFLTGLGTRLFKSGG